jgi:hypothetical protein
MTSDVNSLLGTVLSYKEGIEIWVWTLGLLGIALGAIQLSEAQKQRGLTESFAIYEKIDEQLNIWSTARQSGDDEIDKVLGRILGIIEITTDAINKKYLSKMANSVVTNQIIDSLSVIFSDPHTRKRYKEICTTDAVCGSLKIFLIKKRKKILKTDNPDEILDTIFGEYHNSLIAKGPKNTALRHLYVLKLKMA